MILILSFKIREVMIDTSDAGKDNLLKGKPLQEKRALAYLMHA
jgi:hypothetical protein